MSAIVPDTSAHNHNHDTHARTFIKMITPELFVNLAKGMFGGYSAMMLLMPKKMVTDHFKAECDPVRSDRTHLYIQNARFTFPIELDADTRRSFPDHRHPFPAPPAVR